MNRYNDAIARQAARIWFEVVICDGSARPRRRAVEDWTRADKAARLLHQACGMRRVARDIGRSHVAMNAWAAQAVRDQRGRALLGARDVLYVMRQARRAGVLRVRVPA